MKNWIKTLAVAGFVGLLSSAVIAWAAQTNYLGTVFVADTTTPANQLKVNADGSINITGGGASVSLTCGTGITCSPTTITGTGSVTPTYLGLPFGNVGLPPASASFAWLNQGSATVTQTDGTGAPILLTLPDSNATLAWRGRFISFTAPFTVTAFMRATQGNINSFASGLYFSDGTKWAGMEFLSETSDTELVIRKLTNSGAVSSTTVVSQVQNPWPYGGYWFRVSSISGTMLYQYSQDGSNWITALSEATGTFLTPDRVGFAGLCLTGGSVANNYVSLISWKSQ